VNWRIRFSDPAWAQHERAARWWRRHRDKNPDAFDDDTREALRHIRANPHSGIPIRRRERIGYFIYYKILDNGIIEILALWHAARGSRPRF
jgi:plasmid stabilization system protein ParE